VHKNQIVKKSESRKQIVSGSGLLHFSGISGVADMVNSGSGGVIHKN